MADAAAPAEPEPELPFHERPQDLRQKGNDYEAYLKSTLGPQVVDLLTRLEEAVEFVPDGTIRRPADPRAWLATDLVGRPTRPRTVSCGTRLKNCAPRRRGCARLREERRRANAPPAGARERRGGGREEGPDCGKRHEDICLAADSECGSGALLSSARRLQFA